MAGTDEAGSQNRDADGGLRSLGDHARRLQQDTAALAAEVTDSSADLQRFLTDQMKTRPYRTLGAAAGIGYVVGGGLRSRLSVVLLGSATRLATAFVLRALAARILEQQAQPPSPETSQQSW